MIGKVIALLCCLFFLGSRTAIHNDEVNSKVTKRSDLTQTENSSQAVYRKISAEEARHMMESEAQYIILDVRTDEEYYERRIPGAILIPDYEIVSRAKSELPDKSAHIFIYCRSGRRSANAANELVKMGYTNVYDFGGIIDWPYETVNDYRLADSL